MLKLLDRQVSRINWANPVNWQHPLNRDLLSWWMAIPQHNGWGTLDWDDLGRTQNGATLEGAAFTTEDWVSFDNGFGAVRFQGTPDNIKSSSAISLPSGSISISATFEFTLDPTNTQKVVFYGTSGTTDWTIFMGAESGNIGGGVRTTGAFNSLTGGSISANTVYHAMVQWDGSTAYLYLNGVLEDSTATTGTITGGTSLEFGRNNLSQYFEGYLHDVRFCRGLQDPYDLYIQSANYWPDLLNRNVRTLSKVISGGGGGSAVIAALSNYCNVIIQ